MLKDLSNFKGAFGKTKSDNTFVISKLGRAGLHVSFANEPTEQDKKEVNEMIAKALDADPFNYDAKGATSKERKEDELNAYNEFLRKSKDHL